MLEEWRSGDGIEVLDGWTFQVGHLFTEQLRTLYAVHSVLIRVSFSESLKRRMSNIDFYQITRLF
jgi:hypothetical protein